MSKFLVLAILTLTLFNVLAIGLGWYHSRPWIDIPAHLFFGVLVGLLMLSFHPRFKDLEGWRLIIFLEIAFWGLAAGSFWELIEYARDTIYALPRGILAAQQSLKDTLWDMANNIFGLYAVMVGYLIVTRREHLAKVLEDQEG